MAAVMYTFLTAGIIFLNEFSDIQQYLQIPRDVNFGRMFTNWLDNLLVSTIGQSNTETLVVGAFWAFVGLGVYLLLRGIARFITELGDGVDERNYMWPKGTSRNLALREAVERILFRTLAFIAMLFVVLVPLARLVGGPVFEDFIGPSIPLQLAFWAFFLWFTMHIAVIMLRLVVLRPRLFD
jgi:hypothetical protein